MGSYLSGFPEPSRALQVAELLVVPVVLPRTDALHSPTSPGPVEGLKDVQPAQLPSLKFPSKAVSRVTP